MLDNNTALTFVENDDGVAEYIDGSDSFDIRNLMYLEESIQSDTLTIVYEDTLSNVSMTIVAYQDAYSTNDVSNVIYEDGSSLSDSRQVIYQDSSSSFDTLLEYFLDGVVGAKSFDLVIQSYDDGTDTNDLDVYYYQAETGSFQLNQSIYESDSLSLDTRLILYSDTFTNAYLEQVIYQDTLTDFDLVVRAYDVDMQIVGKIRLSANRVLYELLKGGLDVTAENQNFTMYQGDTKYIDFPIDEVNLVGSSFKWVLKSSVSDNDNIVVKTDASGVTVQDNIIRVKVDPIDTENEKGTLYHELELTDSLGNVSTIATGYITIKRSGI